MPTDLKKLACDVTHPDCTHTLAMQRLKDACNRVHAALERVVRRAGECIIDEDEREDMLDEFGLSGPGKATRA